MYIVAKNWAWVHLRLGDRYLNRGLWSLHPVTNQVPGHYLKYINVAIWPRATGLVGFGLQVFIQFIYIN
jgi:hypothetical protein